MTSSESAGTASAATKLRRMLEGGDIVVAPGVYEGFSARIAHEVGFDCIYMVGLSISICHSNFALTLLLRLALAPLPLSLVNQTLDLPLSTICANTQR